MQNNNDHWCLNGDKNGQGILQITDVSGNDARRTSAIAEAPYDSTV